jgi:hypothetical protein
MRDTHGEKIARTNWYEGDARWLKRATSKWHRRRAKLDPESAPRRRRYREWSD